MRDMVPHDINLIFSGCGSIGSLLLGSGGVALVLHYFLGRRSPLPLWRDPTQPKTGVDLCIAESFVEKFLREVKAILSMVRYFDTDQSGGAGVVARFHILMPCDESLKCGTVPEGIDSVRLFVWIVIRLS